MRLLNLLVALILVWVAGVAAYRLCWERQRCKLAVAFAHERLRLAQGQRSEYDKLLAVRPAIPQLAQCVQAFPDDYQAHFALASAYHVTGRTDDALRSVRAALAVNERPEFYARIAEIQLATGEPQQALANLTLAATFNVGVLKIADTSLREEVMERVKARTRRLRRAAATP